MGISTRIQVKNAGPGTLAILSKLWHQQWYSAMTLESHHAYRMKTLTTPWGRSHVQVLALEEEGRVRSGMIVLSMDMVLAGRKRKVAGIAAVVTDPEQRGRGFAARLITVAHRRLADQGHDAGLLFTEIGTRYYAKLGYIPWPLTRHLLAAPERADKRGYTFAPATTRDLTAQVQLYKEMQERFEARFLRPRAYWRHMLGRARWKDEVLTPIHGPKKKHVAHRWIVRQRGKPVAYARVVPRDTDLTVTDAAYLPGHARALSALLAERASDEAKPAVSIVADPQVVDELDLTVAKRDPIDKMMFAPLEGRMSAADLEPVPQCMWPEDWF